MKPIKRKDYSHYGTYDQATDLLDYRMIRFYKEDPVLFWDIYHSGREYPPSEDYDHMRVFDSAVRSYLFSPEKFQEFFHILSEPLSSEKQDELMECISQEFREESSDESSLSPRRKAQLAMKRKEALAHLKAHVEKRKEIQDRKVLSSRDMKLIVQIKENFQRHEKIQEIWEETADSSTSKIEGFNELEMRWEHACGVWCKTKIDRLVVNYERRKLSVIELMTSSESPRNLASKIGSRGYENHFLQGLAFHTMGLQTECEEMLREQPFQFNYYIIYLGSLTGNVYLYQIDEDRVKGEIGEKMREMHDRIRDILVFKSRNRYQEKLLQKEVDYPILSAF